MLTKLDSDALAGYVARRRREGAGNRTVNIEVGVLRRVLKQFKLWHLVGEDYKPLPEPKDIGRALTPDQEVKLFSVASTDEWPALRSCLREAPHRGCPVPAFFARAGSGAAGARGVHF